jgi:hypothetical protein
MFEVTNAQRADWALSSIANFVKETRVDSATDAITDLIGDLLHLARGRGLNVDTIACNALGMMREEANADEEGQMERVQDAFREIFETDD